MELHYVSVLGAIPVLPDMSYIFYELNKLIYQIKIYSAGSYVGINMLKPVLIQFIFGKKYSINDKTLRDIPLNI